MEYMSVIRNELGEIVRYCKDYTERDNEEYLETHPECYKSVVSIENYSLRFLEQAIYGNERANHSRQIREAGVYTPKQTKKRGKNMAAEQKAAPMPEIVLNTVLEKLDEIENQIKYHDEAKKKLEQEYTELAHAIGKSGK